MGWPDRDMTGRLGGCRLSLAHLLLSLDGTRLSDTLIHMRRELGEIGDEQVDQLRGRAVIFVLVGPGRTRVEDRGVDAGDADRHFEAEVRVLAELDILEASVERGVEKGARGLDRHALSDAVLAA